MPEPVVLVNGIPGAGKTTLARALSKRLHLPLLSKDVIKEAHASVLGSHGPDGGSQREWSRALGIAASDTMWALLADTPGGAILESFWPAPSRRFVIQGLGRAPGRRPLEIWCDVPWETARARFIQRVPTRHPVHGDPADGGGWDNTWADAEPLGLCPVLKVNTSQPIDIETVADWITHRARCGSPDAHSPQFRDVNR